MPPEEILAGIEVMRAEWEPVAKGEIQIIEDRITELSVVRYMSNPCDDVPFFFIVTYEDGRAVEIGVNRDVNGTEPVKLDQLEVFSLPADCIVPFLKLSYSCTADDADEQLATAYEFPELGIRFWREEPFHQKLLGDEEYLDMMGDTVVEMFRQLYFDIVYVYVL
jgi:hypothetical protein